MTETPEQAPLLEAKTFKAWASLDGVPVDIVIRAYVEGDKVLAIRSCRVVDCNGKAYPVTSDGKMSAADLAAIQSPRQLRDSANTPWESE